MSHIITIVLLKYTTQSCIPGGKNDFFERSNMCLLSESLFILKQVKETSGWLIFPPTKGSFCFSF